MRRANPLWGAPRIHGELQKLGIDISETTVAKYLGLRSPSPSPTWRTFLRTHLSQCASMDFFTVPTATFRVLFVLVILSHDRRRVVHVNVTEHPTAAWTRQQIREAFPDQTAPAYLVRDRDGSYGPDFGRLLQSFGTEDVVSAPRSPWHNPFVERVIGTLRRECLDHVIVWNERSLRRTLARFLDYYHGGAPTPLIGEGCAHSTRPTTTRCWRNRRSPTPRRASSPSRTSRRLTISVLRINLNAHSDDRERRSWNKLWPSASR
jgi:transposase InsO family protein